MRVNECRSNLLDGAGHYVCKAHAGGMQREEHTCELAGHIVEEYDDLLEIEESIRAVSHIRDASGRDDRMGQSFGDLKTWIDCKHHAIGACLPLVLALLHDAMELRTELGIRTPSGLDILRNIEAEPQRLEDYSTRRTAIVAAIKSTSYRCEDDLPSEFATRFLDTVRTAKRLHELAEECAAIGETDDLLTRTFKWSQALLQYMCRLQIQAAALETIMDDILAAG